jgi:DNA-binding transcriptional LysR family regulator
MLIELDRLGTVSAVAKRLQYSTSAVSQQLAQLERDFEAPLLEPDGRRVRLTPQGLVLLERAQAVLREWEGARSAVSASHDEVRGTLAVAAYESACLAMVPELVRGLRDAHPEAHVTLVQADADVARERVISRDSDLGIVERYRGQTFPHHPDLVETVLFTDPMLLVVPNDLDFEVTGPRDVADLDWVVEMPGTPTRDWAVALCRRLGFEPRIRFESSDVLVHHNLARSGVAVGFLPALTPAHLLEGTRLIELGAAEARTVYTVARRSQHETPLMAAVLELLAHRPEAAT